MRSRIKRLDPGQLSDAELVALLIGSGAGSTDALDLATDVLRAAGGLHRLADGPRLLRASGIGAARSARLSAAVEIGRRVIEGPKHRRRSFRNPSDAAGCFRARLADLGQEITWWEMPARRTPEPGEEAVALPGGLLAPASQVAFVRGELERVRGVLEQAAGASGA